MMKAKFPKAIFGFCWLFLLAICVTAFADYHYADHDGSNEYPYTSWETAADSIQKAIDAAESGDTVYVGAGVWDDAPYELWEGIALIGMGVDSTILRKEGRVTYIRPYNNALIQGFYFYNPTPIDTSSAIHPDYRDTVIIIKYNEFKNLSVSILGVFTGQIVNNIFIDNTVAISCWIDPCGLIVKNNTFVGNTEGCIVANDGQWFVTNNLFHHNPRASVRLLTLNNHHLGIDTAYVANNLFYANYQEDNWYRDEYCAVTLGTYYENNTFVGLPGIERYVAIGIYYDDTTRITRNCVITDFLSAFYMDGQGITQNLYYNDLWNNIWDNIFGYGNLNFVEGNIHADPMFIDSSNYHLQMFSPLIDAGDPEIQDVDGSRSDIGCYGGPRGESYTYIDLPPRTPDSLDGYVEEDSIILNWRYNTEADFNIYYVFRDTIQGFEPLPINLIAYPETSLYVDIDFDREHNYYYRIAAIDNQDNVSDYSDELAIVFTYVDGFFGDNLPRVTKISNNYPNPFNIQTTISYYLANVGYQPAMVQLYIYNLKGQLVRKLVDESKHPGKHTAIWDGTDDSGNAVSSGIYFTRLTVAGLEFAKPRKIMLIK